MSDDGGDPQHDDPIDDGEHASGGSGDAGNASPRDATPDADDGEPTDGAVSDRADDLGGPEAEPTAVLPGAVPVPTGAPVPPAAAPPAGVAHESQLIDDPAARVAARLRAERERRQRMVVVGLASVGGLVLLIGLVAFLFSRGGGDDAPVSAVPSSSAAPTSAVATSTTSTTVADTTTTTSTTSTTTTTIPLPSAVDAGADLLASAGTVVTLTAADVGEATPGEFVRWVQTAGPDVTAGVGALGGPIVSFTAPDIVGHVAFELRVVDPDDDDDAAADQGVSDELVVRIVEDAATAVFVDLERGDDSAAGTVDAPLRTLAAAAATGNDIHLRSVGRHDTTAGPIVLGPGMDLYGGYDENWFRDPLARTGIDGASTAILVEGDEARVIASIDLIAADAPAGEGSFAVAIDEVDVRIEDSRIVAGAAGAGTSDSTSGAVSVAVQSRNAGQLEIIRSTINGGRGGNGWSGPTDGGPSAGPAASGADAVGSAGAGG
ncbi:MAG: hypothetical protein AAFP84_06070, partial [Actinomycetota bacterium]